MLLTQNTPALGIAGLVALTTMPPTEPWTTFSSPSQSTGLVDQANYGYTKVSTMARSAVKDFVQGAYVWRKLGSVKELEFQDRLSVDNNGALLYCIARVLDASYTAVAVRAPPAATSFNWNVRLAAGVEVITDDFTHDLKMADGDPLVMPELQEFLLKLQPSDQLVDNPEHFAAIADLIAMGASSVVEMFGADEVASKMREGYEHIRPAVHAVGNAIGNFF